MHLPQTLITVMHRQARPEQSQPEPETASKPETEIEENQGDRSKGDIDPDSDPEPYTGLLIFAKASVADVASVQPKAKLAQSNRY